jgi:hypothetical protein
MLCIRAIKHPIHATNRLKGRWVMAIAMEVMESLGVEKPKKETKGAPKRYVMFTLAEWQATINKAFERDVQASEIKNLLLLLCDGTLELLTKKKLEELRAKAAAYDAALEETK